MEESKIVIEKTIQTGLNKHMLNRFMKGCVLISVGLLIFTGCAGNRLQFLHGAEENRQALDIQSRPKPMEIYLDGEFLGVTPVKATLWFRKQDSIMISALGIGRDTTQRSLTISYGSVPRRLTFYSSSQGQSVESPLLADTEDVGSENIPNSMNDLMATDANGQIASDCILPVIHFASNDDHISEIDQAQLKAVENILQSEPDYHLEIHGYADERGTDAYNQQLSLGRSRAVYRLLTEWGIDDSRLNVYGHGEVTALQYDGFELKYSENRIVLFRLYRPGTDD